MAVTIPLFPLGTVLFPGLVLPLHIFEERYRLLVRELVEGGESRMGGNPTGGFGVVAIRAGHEVGAASARTLHEIGCFAELRGVTPHDDGRFDIVTTGSRRFRLFAVGTDRPYLTGEVEWLDEPLGDDVTVLSRAAGHAFQSYRRLLTDPSAVPAPDLPDEPVELSYLVGAAMILDAADKQRLLAAPDAAQRLRLAGGLLRREVALLTTLRALPAVDLLRAVPVSPS